MEEHGQLRRLKVASADPADAGALRAFSSRCRPTEISLISLRSVLESRRPFVVEHVTPEYIESVAQGPEHLQALRATGRHVAHRGAARCCGEQALGVLVFGSSNPSSRVRAGRSSLGRSAGGPRRGGHRECASLSSFGRGHAAPRSGARRRGPRPAESALHDPDAGIGSRASRSRTRTAFAKPARPSTAPRPA